MIVLRIPRDHVAVLQAALRAAKEVFERDAAAAGDPRITQQFNRQAQQTEYLMGVVEDAPEV